MHTPTRLVLCAIGLATSAITALGLVGSVPAKAEDLDMKKIFRCAASDVAGARACAQARTLILDNCTSCHAFVPIVMQQFDRKGWDGLFARHRGRVPQLSNEQLAQMKAYLAANFNPRYPPPALPGDVSKSWSGY